MHANSMLAAQRFGTIQPPAPVLFPSRSMSPSDSAAREDGAEEALSPRVDAEEQPSAHNVSAPAPPLPSRMRNNKGGKRCSMLVHALMYRSAEAAQEVLAWRDKVQAQIPGDTLISLHFIARNLPPPQDAQWKQRFLEMERVASSLQRKMQADQTGRACAPGRAHCAGAPGPGRASGRAEGCGGQR